MFAVRRIIRSNVNLKSQIYTSSVVKCDKPNDRKSNQNEADPDKRQKENKQRFDVGSDSKKKLTAEVKVKDYENFKSKKAQSKIQLYSNTTTNEEKLKAKKELDKLTKEVEKSAVVDTPKQEKFKNLVVPQVRRQVKKKPRNELEESAKAVAKQFGGNIKKTESEILKYLKQWEFKAESEKLKRAAQGDLPKSEEEHEIAQKFIEDEKLMRQRFQRYGPSRDQDFREELGPRRAERRRYEREGPSIVDVIFDGKKSGASGLGIFKTADFVDESPKLKLWDELEEIELKCLARVPPRNYFEELIQWTEDGKLWHFPIDNDQGNEAEANIDFSEHVFLEEYMESWCPKRGPLRHFMELVVTGLSKNYHMTVEEKREHIYWFRDYFEDKKKLLQAMGALDSGKTVTESVEANAESKNAA